MADQVVTATYTYPEVEQGRYNGSFIIKLACTSATAGTVTWEVPATQMDFLAPKSDGTNRKCKFHIYGITTDPGATAPTDNWDLTVENGDSVDILGGNGLNRDTANTEHAAPASGFPMPFGDQLTVKVENAGAEKTLTVYLYFATYSP